MGTIFLSLPIALFFGLKREAVGAGIMMASATASLSAMYPSMADQISALASASETISGIDGIYMAIFLGIPLCNWLYKKLEPKISTVHNKISHKEENK